MHNPFYACRKDSVGRNVPDPSADPNKANRFVKALEMEHLNVEILEKHRHGDEKMTLTLHVDDEDTPIGPLLMKTLHALPTCTLQSFAPRVPTLEDIFLAATKRSWEETIDASKTKSAAFS